MPKILFLPIIIILFSFNSFANWKVGVKGGVFGLDRILVHKEQQNYTRYNDIYSLLGYRFGLDFNKRFGNSNWLLNFGVQYTSAGYGVENTFTRGYFLDMVNGERFDSYGKGSIKTEVNYSFIEIPVMVGYVVFEKNWSIIPMLGGKYASFSQLGMRVYSQELGVDKEFGNDGEYTDLINQRALWGTIAVEVACKINKNAVLSFRPFYELSVTPFYKDQIIASEYHYYYGMEFVISGMLK